MYKVLNNTVECAWNLSRFIILKYYYMLQKYSPFTHVKSKIILDTFKLSPNFIIFSTHFFFYFISCIVLLHNLRVTKFIYKCYILYF